MSWKWMGAALLSASLGFAQSAQHGPKIEVSGTIEKVQIARGEGMPYLELKTESGTQRVMLGSMRYLMENNFSPKAGEKAVVKGFKMNDRVMAQSVTLPKGNVTLQLRDDEGRPMWRQQGKKGNRGPGKRQA